MSHQFTEALGYSIVALGPEDVRRYLTPYGILRPTETAVILFMDEYQNDEILRMRCLVCSEQDIMPEGIDVIFGRSCIDQMKRR